MLASSDATSTRSRISANRLRSLAMAALGFVILALGPMAKPLFAAPAVSSLEMSLSDPPASSCTAPAATSSFLISDGSAWLFFVATTTTADTMTSDWLAPNGDVLTGGYWTPQAGTFCFTGESLSLTNQSAGHLGSWKARIYDNGVQLTSISFTLSAAVPAISGLAPSSIAAGGPAFQLTVNGSNFLSGSSVLWNQTNLVTAFVSATQLTATVSASLIAGAGTASVTVSTGGQTSGAASFTITSSTTNYTYYFPHLAVGNGFQTIFTYVNYSPRSVSCQTTFYSDTGSSLQIPFATGTVPSRTDSLGPGADVHIQTTAPVTSSLLAGWAVAQCTGAIKGSLLFRLYSGTVAQGEAGVNASTVPATEFVTFAQTATGIAYANPSGSTANITVTALNQAGVKLGGTVFALPPNGHGAANVGPLLGLGSFTGSVQITSTTPIVALSLNAEVAPVFSSLPPGDLPSGTPLATGSGNGSAAGATYTSTYYFPHLAVGNGFQTTLTYVNYSAQNVNCNTTFYSDTGGALQIPFANGTLLNRADNMNAGAAIHVQTTAAANSSLLSGWAQAQCTGPIKASLLYRLYSGPVAQGEAGVNASTTAATEFVSFAQTATGVAYANPSGAQATVTINALDSTGAFLAGTALTLQPNAHGAANIGPLLALSSFSGSVQITSTTPIVSLSLNAEASPVFSSLPPGDLPAGTPLGHSGSGGVSSIQGVHLISGNSQIAHVGTLFASPLVVKVVDANGVPVKSASVTWAVTQGSALLSASGNAGTNGQATTNVTAGSAPGSIVVTAGSGSSSVTFTLASAAVSNNAVSITKLSSASAMALTPISVSTSGLDIAAPVTVQFAGPGGYFATSDAIRVISDGTVVVAVPLYVNPATGVTGAANVTVSLVQNGKTSSSQTLAIQDLPSVASYGVKPGDLSRAYINYSSMVTALRLNELQAVQATPGNKVSTSAAQSTLRSLLLAQIDSRSDVDRLVANPNLVLAGGTISSGSVIQFDKNSLDIMDRIYGMYLTEDAAAASAFALSSPSSPAFAVRSMEFARIVTGLRMNKVVIGGTRVSRKRTRSTNVHSDASTIQNILDSISTVGNYLTVIKSKTDRAAEDATTADKIVAFSKGFGAVVSQGAIAFPVAKPLDAVVGAFNAVLGLANNFGNEIGATAFIMLNCNDGSYGADDETCSMAADDIEKNRDEAWKNTIDAEEKLLGLALPKSLQAAYEIGNAAYESASTIKEVAECIESTTCSQSVVNAGAQVASQLEAGFNSAVQYGVVTGKAILETDLGAAAPLPGLDFYGGDSFNTLGDSTGGYDMLLPIHDPNFSYSDTDVEILDPESDETIGSLTVDLSGLGNTLTLSIPSVTGSCYDDDAGDPDGDDPDCD